MQQRAELAPAAAPEPDSLDDFDRNMIAMADRVRPLYENPPLVGNDPLLQQRPSCTEQAIDAVATVTYGVLSAAWNSSLKTKLTVTAAGLGFFATGGGLNAFAIGVGAVAGVAGYQTAKAGDYLTESCRRNSR